MRKTKRCPIPTLHPSSLNFNSLEKIPRRQIRRGIFFYRKAIVCGAGWLLSCRKAIRTGEGWLLSCRKAICTGEGWLLSCQKAICTGEGGLLSGRKGIVCCAGWVLSSQRPICTREGWLLSFRLRQLSQSWFWLPVRRGKGQSWGSVFRIG